MDIFKITKSKTRKKILRFFFSNVNKKYYLRELERILDITVGNIRRELLSLKKSGLFRSQKMGNQVYYFLNKKSPIFKELKAIISKTLGVEAIIKKELMKVKGVEIAFIYGSFARQKEDTLSDIDIFIIGQVAEDDLIRAIRRVEKQLSREINYVVFTKNDLIKAIKKKNVFLEDVLQSKKLFLIGNKNELEKIIR